MINLNVREAVSSSWDVNKTKSLIVKVVFATGAAISSLFSCYKIELSAVCARVKVEKGYDKSYLVQSLKRRNITIDTPSISLLKVDDKFKDHYKILIDGNNQTSKSSLINALREAIPDSKDFIQTGENDDITYHEFGDNIVLCEMPNWIVTEGHFMYDSRYDNYDGVVVLTDTDTSLPSTEYDLMKLAQHAWKPFLLVRSNIDEVVNKASPDEDFVSEEESLKLESDRIKKNLAECRVFPKNRKPLLVDFQQPNRYDFKELKELIETKDLSGDSIPPCPSLLKVPEKFKSHFKILIDGAHGTGKSSLINALRKTPCGSEGFIPNNRNEKITFYEFGDDIVLCEMSSEIISRNHFMCDSRYDNYDGVVILTEFAPRYKGIEYDLVGFAQDARKPYLLVRNKMELAIVNAPYDGEGSIREDIIQSEYNVITRRLKEKALDHPSTLEQQKPLLVELREPDKHDFRELEEVIKSKDFTGRSLSNEI